MPLYDVKCQKCGRETEVTVHIEDRDKVICMNCGGHLKSLCSTGGKDWFREHVNEDFDGTPIVVKSRRHLKDLCKKHGVYARTLD